MWRELHLFFRASLDPKQGMAPRNRHKWGDSMGEARRKLSKTSKFEHQNSVKHQGAKTTKDGLSRERRCLPRGTAGGCFPLFRPNIIPVTYPSRFLVAQCFVNALALCPGSQKGRCVGERF